MPHAVQLIINRTEIYNNYMRNKSIIIEDNRLNCSSCCYIKHTIFKIHRKNDVVCVLRKHSKKELLSLILLYHSCLNLFPPVLKNDNQRPV